MIFDSLGILLPLFLLIGGGYLVGRIYSLSEGPLVRVVTEFFMPLLVFYSFCTVRMPVGHIARLIGVVSFVVMVMLLASWLYSKSFRLDFRAVAPPLLFMNSGFLGIPIMKLWGGLGAMNLVIIYDQIQTFFIFTLGIVIVTGSYRLKGVIEMLRSPLIWAILLGFGFNLAEIEVHAGLLNAMRFGGDVAPPLATFAIGVTLNHYRIQFNKHLVIGILLRMGLGFFLGAVAASLFGFTGMEATVVTVASALPSAVFSVVLPVRYGVSARYASSLLIGSTLVSLLTLPFMFTLSSLLFG